MDDIFAKASDSKDAFESLTEETPRNSFKPKKENYWDKQDIQPTTIDVTKFKGSTKAFAIYVHPENDIPESAHKTLLMVAGALMEKGHTFRHTGNKDNHLHNEILALENTKVESYLPWKKFNANISDPILANPMGYRIAIGIHKSYMKLPNAVRAILASSVNALTGTSADAKVDFVLTWTDGGAEALTKDTDFKQIGNNTFVLQIAKRAGIPVFNVFNSDFIERFKKVIG